SRAMAGIGCHYMATWMDRRTDTFTQMGGEGVTWIGQAPFTETRHVFQNLGDGTYFHSGILAIRAAVAAKVNITYKLLFNDAVAMTGGQPLDGQLSVPQITRQLAAEGVSRILVMSDEPEKYTDKSQFAADVSIHHRRELDRIQRELRERDGVSVLIYDQTCAAEKRRRRKRGKLADPPKRAFINELVCEGCGDCSVQSNCLSVEPVETEFGRKRQINQSSCNKDLTCVDGFCPSFVTVHGGQLRKPAALDSGTPFPALPEPPVATLEQTYSILITGIGGTGVVTIGALLGMAAHLEGKGVSVLDMTGLAQKFGAVISHVRIANSPEAIRAPRIPAGEANLLLACDLAVAASFDALAKLNKELSFAVINTHQSMPAEFIRKPDLKFHAFSMERAIVEAVGQDQVDFIEASQLATRLLGDSIAANLFLLGYAYQKGLLPLSAGAIEQAIELNAVAVEFNQQAFLWGRRAAHDLAAVQALVQTTKPVKLSTSLDAVVSRRMDYLTAYQNRAYAERYQALVNKVRQLDGGKELSQAVAHNYFKLLAYKDEYEVARLYTDGTFEAKLKAQFEGDFRLQFHLAPPLFNKPDPKTGKLEKRTYGPWMLSVFKLLAKLKSLRGSYFDPFGYSAERKQ
ncbi:MAG: indolepyruvate ferredoxin oxidoreductase family protein, partial [Candidatus Competibacteraceae bacterium]|nr:indolepyruvate ferredoxin oxidoreductase family protein [Candidatus Competibacteraceae bacterium]